MRALILFMLMVVSLSSQARDLIYKEFLLNDKLTSITQNEIQKYYGKGKIKLTNYECGFYANEHNGTPYYQIIFNELIFIGNDKESFSLQHFFFTENTKNTISFKGVELNSNTTKAEFIEIFGKFSETHFRENPNSNEILLFYSKSDDGARFKFKNNKLVEYIYWTPC